MRMNYDQLVCFLYLLMRDYCPTGAVKTLVGKMAKIQDCNDYAFTNRELELMARRYAQIAMKLPTSHNSEGEDRGTLDRALCRSCYHPKEHHGVLGCAVCSKCKITGELLDCTRSEGHSGPCNGWPLTRCLGPTEGV